MCGTASVMAKAIMMTRPLRMSPSGSRRVPADRRLAPGPDFNLR
jgi:hypothetical protein